MSENITSAISREIFNELNMLARVGADSSGGVTRLAYTELDRQAKEYIKTLFQNEGMQVKEDTAGNIIARRSGREEEAPAVAIGSHIDTVVNGGIYDGTVGVLAGLEVVRKLNKNNIVTDHPIEIIVFASEESSRFGVSTIGSKAMAGKIEYQTLEMLKDLNNIAFREAVESHGLSYERFLEAKRNRRELKAFIELHIEQGPVLESEGCKIGIATAIAAPTRYHVTIEGTAGHSGTTTMNLRKDALIAASEIVLQVEEIALQAEHLVGTVGVQRVYPCAANTIPGKVEMIVEFRSVDRATKRQAQDNFTSAIKEIEEKRNVSITVDLLSDEEPVLLDNQIAVRIESVCQQKQIPYEVMISGAGHDAMNIAALCPTGLMFIPSINGISHHPDECSKEADIVVGIDVLYDTVLQLTEGE
jgi:hydantoinase/carbamoylase family amidase